MGPGQHPQRLGQRERQQIISTGQKVLLLFGQPALGLFSMALGTMTIAAGVVTEVLVSTLVALIKLAATGRGAATH